MQAQVAVGDINGDGAVELVVGDARGNIAAFDQHGNEVWERHVGSQINQVGGRVPGLLERGRAYAAERTY